MQSVFFHKSILLISFFLACILGLFAGFLWALSHDLPEINRLKQFRPMEVSTIFDSRGQVLDKFFIEKRFPVSMECISPLLIEALITTEDRSFYSHVGINPKAIVRAIVQDIVHGHFKQGGSTLTQQLAKTLFLSPEKSIIRKIKEALLSLQIERRYTKEEILELYLNQIYLGSASYGVEAAARTYFQTRANHLTLGQAALIAGLPKAPSRYSPLANHRLAKIRRDTVLRQMLETGKITRQDYEKALTEPVLIKKGTNHDKEPSAFFTAYIKKLLEEDPRFAKNYSNGLRIYTTLDSDLSRTAADAMEKHLTELENRMKSKGTGGNKKLEVTPESAVVGLDAQDGAVRILAGGRDFTKSPFNRAIQAKRQPGSAFKSIVYAAAITKGYSQTCILEDSPLSLTLENGKTWQVNNFSVSHDGMMTMRRALALSKNTTAVRLQNEITPQAIIDFSRKLGITSWLAPYPSLALGSFELSLMEITRAYIPFVNQGIGATPFAIREIRDQDGHILFSVSPKKTKVMSRQDAAIVTDMLKAVIFEGTGKKAAHLSQEIAGKTGTTNNYKDALFVGYSPGLVLGVWVGNDDASSLGKYETGSKAALPIWIDIMEKELAKGKIQYFDIPDQTKMVYIDDRSGEIFNLDQNIQYHNGHIVKALVRSPRKSIP